MTLDNIPQDVHQATDNNVHTSTFGDIMNADDALVAAFFTEQRQELTDNGFSQHVMRQLPSRTVRLNQIWTAVCAGIGIVLFFLLDGLQQLKLMATNMLGNLEGFAQSVDFTYYPSPVIVILACLLLFSFTTVNVVMDNP